MTQKTKEQELKDEIEKREQEYIKKGKSYLILTTPSIIKLKTELKGRLETKQYIANKLKAIIRNTGRSSLISKDEIQWLLDELEGKDE